MGDDTIANAKEPEPPVSEPVELVNTTQEQLGSHNNQITVLTETVNNHDSTLVDHASKIAALEETVKDFVAVGENGIVTAQQLWTKFGPMLEGFLTLAIGLEKEGHSIPSIVWLAGKQLLGLNNVPAPEPPSVLPV